MALWEQLKQRKQLETFQAQRNPATHSRLDPSTQPVSIREFVTSPRYLNKPTFWPKALDDLERLKAPGILGGVIEVGIGGGKSFLSCTLPLYDIYCLEFMQTTQGIDLFQRYELDKDSPIYVAVIAASGKIAKEVYRYMRQFAEGCEWFLEHLPLNPRITSELQFRRPGEDQVRYIGFPGHSKLTSVISRNLYSYVLDESNFFTVAQGSQSSGKDYAEEVDQQLSGRVDSRFGKAGSRITISSRSTVNDFTHRKKAKLRRSARMAAKYYLPEPRTSWGNWPETRCLKEQWRLFDPTSLMWEAEEPISSWDDCKDRSGLWVPERFWDEFEARPEEALKNLASIPAEANSPFIRRRDKIVPDWDMVSPVLPGVKPTAWMTCGHRFDDLVADWFVGDPNEIYHFHVDLALNGDKCGITVSRNSGTDEVALGRGERRPERVVCVDIEALIQIKAPPGGEIDFAKVREILYWLRDQLGFKFRKSSYDGWQSVDSQQILKHKGFLIEQLSVDRNLEPYTNLKDALYEGRLFFPPAHGQTPETTWDQLRRMAESGDPCAVFQIELGQLENVNGKKVDHPSTGSKDVADSAAGAVTQAIRQPRMSRDLGM